MAPRLGSARDEGWGAAMTFAIGKLARWDSSRGWRHSLHLIAARGVVVEVVKETCAVISDGPAEQRVVTTSPDDELEKQLTIHSPIVIVVDSCDRR